MLKRILVGLGGPEYTTSAINHAVSLALAHDAQITGVSVLDEARLTHIGPVPLGGGAYARELAEIRLHKAEEHIEWAVKEFTDACSAAGVRYQVVREVGEPFTLMISLARYHDLMVFGLRGLFEFDLVDDPQDALVKLVESGVRPLLAVSKGFYPTHKVLVAYSGSMESAKAMKRFVQMRLWPDAELRVISFDDGQREAAKLAEDAADYCRTHGFAVEFDCVAGESHDDLLPYAEQWNADLIVVGNSAKSLWIRRVFGETAMKVIREAERPLFLAQ